MERTTKLYYLCLILGVRVVPVILHTTAGYEVYNENTTDTKSEEQSSEVVEGILENFRPLLRMATVCETPNHDPGYCVGIRECDVLLKQLNNSKAREFMRQSKCGPDNEDLLNPKVCCGKYDNFRNISTAIVEDDKIFPKICGQQKLIVRGRIIGGKEASLGEYPWMARIIHKNKYGYKSFGCSGFLVHVKYIITAAHCTHPKHTEIRGPLYAVVLGEHNTETTTDCSAGGTFCAEPRQISRIAKVLTHPDYDPENYAHYNDIAIIHMKKGARLSGYVQPICLLMDESQIPPSYYLSGWGKTELGSSSKIKLKVEIASFDQTECKEKYSFLNINLKDTQICAGGEHQKDSCTGDSGGPLMMPTSNGTWYASGIVSFGIGCGMKGWPGVYTNIVKFLPWIKSQIMLNSMLSAKSNFKKKRKNRHKKNKKIETVKN